MDRNDLIFWLSVAGVACWAVCFPWMYRISKKQNRLLTELQAQAKRIEQFSKAEHDLIKQVHPKVDEIQADVKDVASKVQQREPQQGD